MKIFPREFLKLADVIDGLYPRDAAIYRLFKLFFGCKEFEPGLASKKLRMARDPTLSWAARRIAVLMLENEALRMWKSCGFGEQSVWFLGELGILVDGRIPESVLREGYSTTEAVPFAMELRARLSRFDRIHCRIDGWDTEPEALRDFLHVAGLDCKLTLARYIFQPDEIARRILNQVRITPGQESSGPSDLPGGPTSPSAVFDEMLVAQLRRDRKVLWVSSTTPSELNSLIEYPLDTVVLVIKPPGSDQEFEIKRAGMRGRTAVDVLFERNGVAVPVPHRMQGTSTGPMLHFERCAGRNFAAVYRGTHGVDPPASRMLGCTSVTTVPNGHGNVQILEYLSDPGAFSGDFGVMRDHLKRCVAAYEGTQQRQDLPGEFGWTMRFFNRVVPNQAWIEGTSSFRLDRIAELLSVRGPDSYFRAGLGREFGAADERRLADEVLEEVLGVVQPPEHEWTNFTAYVKRALDVHANRSAADAAYLDAIQETGRYWGTLLGTGGFSEGESFVTRNVGIKSRWQAATGWRPRICFMDHDNMNVPVSDIPDISRTLGGMRGDQQWVCGHRDRSIMACLKKIYRPSAVIEGRGEVLLRQTIEDAFRATRRAMMHCEAVRGLFRPDYLSSLQRRDEVVRLYLKCGQSRSSRESWRKKAKEILSKTVYGQETVPAFLGFITRFDALVRAYAFLVMDPESENHRVEKGVTNPGSYARI